MRRPGIGWGKLSRIQVELAARESFERSQFISFEEARARIGGRLAKRDWNQYFRTDGTGPGIWVTCWSKGEEVVLTYLHPESWFIGLKPSQRVKRSVRRAPARV